MATKGRKRDRDGIYTRPDRSGFWTHWTDAQGKRRWRKIKGAQTLTQARQARAAEMLRVEQTKTLGFAPPGEETFAEVSERYLKHQKPRLSDDSYKRTEGVVTEHLKPFFAGRLASIRRGDVQRYITKRCGDVKPDTVVKEFNILKHLLALAVEWEVIPQNPATGIKAPKSSAGRVRYLTKEEFKVLFDACPDWLRPIMVLAMATGMRRSEVLNLRWFHLHITEKTQQLILPKTKNGEARIIYLNGMAVAALKMVQQTDETKPNDLLFPNVNPAQVSVAFKRLCVRMKITDFRLHDLRHTAASWMRMQGADIHTVAELLGHKDLRMAARYQHLSPAFKAEAVRKLDDVFGDVCYQAVTEQKQLPEGDDVSALESWRPRRDLNPCYRRERAVS